MNRGSLKELYGTTPFCVWFLLAGILLFSAASAFSFFGAFQIERGLVIAALACGVLAFSVFFWLAKPLWKNSADRKKLTLLEKYNLKR